MLLNLSNLPARHARQQEPTERILISPEADYTCEPLTTIPHPRCEHRRMTATSDPLDSFIDAAARALGLPLEPEWKSAVKANLMVTLGHAALVDEFKLPDEVEPAPVFRA